MTPDELKNIQTTLKQTRIKKKEIDDDIIALQTRLKERQNHSAVLNHTIIELEKRKSKPDVVVTEHAMLRLFERVYNLPVKEKQEEPKDAVRPYMGFSRTGKFTVYEKFHAVVKDGVIVTVEPA